MGVPKRLTEMQMKFAHEIVSNEGRKNGLNVLSLQVMLKTQLELEHQNYKAQRYTH